MALSLSKQTGPLMITPSLPLGVLELPCIFTFFALTGEGLKYRDKSRQKVHGGGKAGGPGGGEVDKGQKES